MLDRVNAEVATSDSPETFAAEIEAEMTRWEKVIPELATLPEE
jgi:hypothetical protein